MITFSVITIMCIHPQLMKGHTWYRDTVALGYNTVSFLTKAGLKAYPFTVCIDPTKSDFPIQQLKQISCVQLIKLLSSS